MHVGLPGAGYVLNDALGHVFRLWPRPRRQRRRSALERARQFVAEVIHPRNGLIARRYRGGVPPCANRNC